MRTKWFWQENICGYLLDGASRLASATCIGIAVYGLSGCAGYTDWHTGNKLVQEGKIDEGLQRMQQASVENPEHYRMKFIAQRDNQIRSLMQKASAARYNGYSDQALSAYQEVLHLDAQNTEASRGIELIAREQREKAEMDAARSSLGKGDASTARQLLNAIISENPRHAQARQMSQEIDAQYTRNAIVLPALNESLQAPVTLELKDVDIRSILEILTQTSGISFIMDKDVSPDVRSTIYARNTTVIDALNLILQTSQLEKKILNDSTILIYPANEEKKKRYDDLIVRSYYLNSADPKKVQEMLRALVAPKSVYVDDRLKMLVVRDTESVQETVLRLLNLYDIVSPEVILEVEVLEVNSNDLLNLGIQFPTSVSASLIGPTGISGSMTIDQLTGLNKNSFPLTFPDPLAVLNLRQTSSNTRTLANPRIRVLNREKASVLIGDKVPVITSTVNQTSSAITESVNYLDVGLKLEVEPEIHVDNDVTMRVALEVSNIVKEVRSSATGLLAYQVGTRNANTVLRLHDGETQALAGLIKSDSQASGTHIPGLGKIPIVGRLFSNNSDSSTSSEIVLLITPHVTRSLAMPGSYAQTFPSGTAEQVSTRPLRLMPAAQYSGSDSLPPSAAPTANTTGAPPANRESAPAIPSAGLTALANRLSDQNQTATVRFDLAAPTGTTAKTAFVVNVLASGPSFEKAELDLVLDGLGVKLIKVEPRPGVVLDAKQSGNIVHFSLGKATADGVLASITLQADHPSGGSINLSLQNLNLENEKHAHMRTAVALPKQVSVSP